MRRRGVSSSSSAVLVGAAARGVSAQTATADGVAALARGDYQRAVEILKPIAEDWNTEDRRRPVLHGRPL